MSSDPTDSDDTCPGCGATSVQPQPAPPTVQAWTCTACGLHWCTAVVNPALRVALSIVGLLPTPQQRSAALLDVMRAEVARRSGPEHPMTDTVCLPATEVISIDAMASVDTVVWWCRMCDHHATATTRPAAQSEGVAHLTDQHRATIGSAPKAPARPPVEPHQPVPRVVLPAAWSGRSTTSWPPSPPTSPNAACSNRSSSTPTRGQQQRHRPADADHQSSGGTDHIELNLRPLPTVEASQHEPAHRYKNHHDGEHNHRSYSYDPLRQRWRG